MSSRISRKWGRNRTFRFWRLCSWALNLSMENSFFAQNPLIAKIGVYLTPWKYSSQWQLAPLSPHWAEWVSASLRSPGQITHSLLCGSKTWVKGNEWRNLGLKASKPQLRACADQKFQSAQPAPHLWSHSFCYLRLFTQRMRSIVWSWTYWEEWPCQRQIWLNDWLIASSPSCCCT